MSERIEQAVEMFVAGYSCAQSLLAVYGPSLGMEREAALRLAAPLGGGMSRTDGPCGAATGAILVLGLKHGHTHPDDDEGAEFIRDLAPLESKDRSRETEFLLADDGAGAAFKGLSQRTQLTNPTNE